MRISVFGLGYVGAVSGACLAKRGHQVIGVDPDRHKLSIIERGEAPVREHGLDQLLTDVVRSGALQVTSDPGAAVSATDVSLVCVGTPSREDGSLDTGYLERCLEDIGAAVLAKGSPQTVVIRSTVVPGTTDRLVIPLLEETCGGPMGEVFRVAVNPEFLREGTALRDFEEPPFTVLGCAQPLVHQQLARLYEGLPGETIACSLAAAEALKFSCNIFHAVKITVANEIGTVCRQAGVDAREVMDLVCRDTKLNISARYLRPGFAFGGSCLPKDLRAFTALARQQGEPLPLFEASLNSNRLQIERCAQRIMARKKRRISLLGLSFKEGTDDLRESPLVALSELLIGKGIQLRIYDPEVEYASLYGSNKRFIDEELPHLKSILGDAKEVIEHAEMVVFGHQGERYRDLLGRLTRRQEVFDLVGICRADEVPGPYTGLYW